MKRYVKRAREGDSLSSRRRPGRRPKADERAGRLLEADLEERTSATRRERCEYLRGASGLRVERLLGQMEQRKV